MLQETKIARDLVTVDDFFAMVKDGEKADLIEGVIYMASPDSRQANKLTGFIYRLLEGYAEAREIGGEVVFSRFAFQIGPLNAPEPDVAYISPERVKHLTETRMTGGPDIAVEVVSRDSRTRDYQDKFHLYQEAGVSEYWIIDPIQRRVEFYRLAEKKYQLAPLVDNRRITSEALPGFWIDIDWLLADPLPPATRCLAEILGEGRDVRPES